MPSRRSLLGAVGVVGSVAVSGCSAVAGPPGKAVTTRNDVLDVPEAESAPIVARGETRSGDHGCPEGIVTADARVHRVADSPERLVLVTEYDVITGESACSSGWGQTGIDVRHDWRPAAVGGDGVDERRSQYVPAGEGDHSPATLERRRAPTRAEWRVHLTPPTKSTQTYRFVSAVPDPGGLKRGDEIASTGGEARVRNGWLGGNDALGETITLRYGTPEGKTTV